MCKSSQGTPSWKIPCKCSRGPERSPRATWLKLRLLHTVMQCCLCFYPFHPNSRAGEASHQHGNTLHSRCIAPWVLKYPSWGCWHPAAAWLRGPKPEYYLPQAGSLERCAVQEHRAPTQHAHIPPPLSWLWVHPSFACAKLWFHWIWPCNCMPANITFPLWPSQNIFTSCFYSAFPRVCTYPRKGEAIPKHSFPVRACCRKDAKHTRKMGLRTGSMPRHYGNARHNASSHMTDWGMLERPAQDNSLGVQPSHSWLSTGALEQSHQHGDCHKATPPQHGVDRSSLHKAVHTHMAMQVCVQQHHGTRETVNSICRKRHNQSHMQNHIWTFKKLKLRLVDQLSLFPL